MPTRPSRADTTSYGAGYAGGVSMPYQLRFRVKSAFNNSGTYDDISNAVPIESVQVTRDARGLISTLTFDIVAKSGAFSGYSLTLNDNAEVWVDDTSADGTSAGRYDRYFGGYIGTVTTTGEGSEKKWTVVCRDYGDLLDRAPQQITTQYPPGDGTPVVNTTSASDVASSGTVSLVVVDASHIYIGKKLYLSNTTGNANTERITVTDVNALTVSYVSTFARTGSTNTIIVSSGITDQELIANGWSAHPNTGTTVAAAITLSGSPQTITVASSTDFVSGTNVRIQSATGTNVEFVKLTAVGSGTITGIFTISRPAGAVVFPMKTYQSLIDYYYGNNSVTIAKSSIAECITSLPHMKFTAMTIREALDQIKQQNNSNNNFVTTCATDVAASGVRPFTVASATSISAGLRFWAYNADGTHAESTVITSISGTTANAYFTTSKTGSAGAAWNVVGGVNPNFYMTFNFDPGDHTTWTPTLVWFDTFNPTNQTAISLTDAAITDVTTQAAYETGYNRFVDGTRRVSTQTVMNPTTAAQYTYTDTPTQTALGRKYEAKPIVASDILTNADAQVRATTYVNNFRKARETIRSVKSKGQLAVDLFQTPHTIKFTQNLEGATPAVYNLARVVLTFADSGVPTYEYELGDTLEELGDKPLPALGAGGSQRDTTPPQAPTWGPGTTWLLNNTWYGGVNPGTSQQQVQWISSGELDIDGFVIQWSYDQITWFGTGLAGTSTNFTYTQFTVSTVVYWRVRAFDVAGNYSPWSLIVNATTAAYPTIPVPTSIAVNFNPGLFAGITVQGTWAISDPTSRIAHYECYWQEAALPAVIVATSGIPSPLAQYHDIHPFTTGTFTVRGVDTYGNLGSYGTPVTWTGGQSDPGPTEFLINGNFAARNPSDATLPMAWTLSGSGTNSIDTVLAAIKGVSALKLTCANGQTRTALSSRVAVVNPATVGISSLYKTYADVILWATTSGLGQTTIAVKYYDLTDTLLSTVTVDPATATSTTPKQKFTPGGITPPNNAIACRLSLTYNNNGGGASNDVYFSACHLQDATTTPGIGNLDVKQAPLIFTKDDGTQIGKQGYSGSANQIGEYDLADHAGTTLGKLLAYDDLATVKIIQLLSVGTNVEIDVHSTGELELQNDTGDINLINNGDGNINLTNVGIGGVSIATGGGGMNIAVSSGGTLTYGSSGRYPMPVVDNYGDIVYDSFGNVIWGYDK